MVRPAAALVLACVLAAPVPAGASQRTPAREPAPAPAAASEQPALPTQDARETRNALERLLEQYPPSLARVLRLDPTLLQNQDYLRPYAALAAFLAQHPDVVHNPSYFFARYGDQSYGPQDPKERAFAIWDKTIEGFMITLVFTSIFGGIVWLIKTAVDHRRWAKLTKIQSDVHTKLLDRFASNEDLLAYIQTPAGRHFLESTPIAIDSPRALNAPLGRILWSTQIGAVLAVAGIGIEIVAARAIEEVSQPLSAIGVIVIALGIGFGISAVIAYLMSRRLGLLGPASPAMEPRG